MKVLFGVAQGTMPLTRLPLGLACAGIITDIVSLINRDGATQGWAKLPGAGLALTRNN